MADPQRAGSEHVERGPVQATARIVPPYLYDLLWRLALYGPMTAQELADDHNRPVSLHSWEKWTAQATANRLRGPQKLGLIERDEDGFWLLTSFGRAWMTTRTGS